MYDTSNSILIHRDIEEEMRSSFLAYSMSVITSRALPDVRDGLKPVHRRILYTLFEKSLNSSISGSQTNLPRAILDSGSSSSYILNWT